MGGKTVDNVEELDILTYDGLRMRVGATDGDALELIRTGGARRAEIYSRLKELANRYADEIRRRYPKIPRRVSGYNLDDLLPEKGFHVARSLVGSEGTCALTIAATLRLLPWPPKRSLLVLGYPEVARAADDVVELRSFGPDALEAFDGHVVDNMKRKGKPVPGEGLLPQGRAWLLVEFGGDEQKEANDKAEKAFARLKKIGTHASDMRLIEPAEDQDKVWHIRENGVGASHIPGVEEVVALLGRCGRAARAARRLFARFRQTQRALRLYHDPFRPFRRRLRTRAHDLRAEDSPRGRPLPRVHAGGV